MKMSLFKKKCIFEAGEGVQWVNMVASSVSLLLPGRHVKWEGETSFPRVVLCPPQTLPTSSVLALRNRSRLISVYSRSASSAW